MKTISISLSPNTEKDDIALAKRCLSCREKIKGECIDKLEKKIKEDFQFKNVLLTNSGRSSLMLILESIGIQDGDEIIIQGFTCNAVVNPIMQSGAKPVYVDIDETLNIDVLKIEEKITNRTRAIIVQHNFGYPGDVLALKNICDKYSLLFIEDCAHALGAKINGEFCGSFGDVSFFSFGRDKVISSVYGGMIVVQNELIREKMEQIYKGLDFPSEKWTTQQLRHPIIMNEWVLPLYDFLNIGKIILTLSIKFGILSKAVTPGEYQGKLPDYFPKKLPNALACLALKQLEKLEKFNEHRRELAKMYFKNIGGVLNIKEGAIYLKYPLMVEDPESILKELEKYGFMLDDGWRKKTIVPPKTNLEKMDYKKGTCPIAERLAEHILVLPTHVNIDEETAEKIIYLLKTYI